MDDLIRGKLDHLRTSLGQWALGDVKKTAEAGAKVGAFILGANLIDVLARLAYSKQNENGSAAWDEFVPDYLPRYGAHANALYKGFRSAVSHNYSLDGIRLTDGQDYAHRHWTIERGERVLHLESFVSDLEAAFEAFNAALERDTTLRKRVLDRIDKRPLLGIVGGYGGMPTASAASSISGISGATHFGLIVDADAATDPARLIEPPKMTVPKGRRKQN